jgi:cytochrome c553
MLSESPVRRAFTVRRFFSFVGMLAFVCPLVLAQPAPRKGDPARGETKIAATCHGDAARAPLPGMPLLAAQPAQFLTLQMILLREGLRDIPQMAPFLKGLTDRDIIDIAEYYTHQPLPKNVTERNAALYSRGAVLSKAMGCGSCHRGDYSGQNQVPRIAGQREDYLAHALKAYRADTRVGTDTNMNGIVRQTSDDDINAMAHYFALQ